MDFKLKTSFGVMQSRERNSSSVTSTVTFVSTFEDIDSEPKQLVGVCVCNKSGLEIVTKL